MNPSMKGIALLQRAKRSGQRLVIMSVLTVCLLLGAGAATSFMHRAAWQAGVQIAATEGDIHIGSFQVAATTGDVHIGS
ncbi:MAG: hypothetical protein ACJ8AG_24875 [Ktedonobacteraceae bacterium]